MQRNIITNFQRRIRRNSERVKLDAVAASSPSATTEHSRDGEPIFPYSGYAGYGDSHPFEGAGLNIAPIAYPTFSGPSQPSQPLRKVDVSYFFLLQDISPPLMPPERFLERCEKIKLGLLVFDFRILTPSSSFSKIFNGVPRVTLICSLFVDRVPDARCISQICSYI
jgi:hypothetical protein